MDTWYYQVGRALNDPDSSRPYTELANAPNGEPKRDRFQIGSSNAFENCRIKG